mmetsp:Transcript_19989/g.48019  ORF Transcript_19989/g.48019 Transcript_19989/m.48019 type:complete len:217 (-) Transcript_19989:1091-1741(-)
MERMTARELDALVGESGTDRRAGRTPGAHRRRRATWRTRRTAPGARMEFAGGRAVGRGARGCNGGCVASVAGRRADNAGRRVVTRTGAQRTPVAVRGRGAGMDGWRGAGMDDRSAGGATAAAVPAARRADLGRAPSRAHGRMRWMVAATIAGSGTSLGTIPGRIGRAREERSQRHAVHAVERDQRACAVIAVLVIAAERIDGGESHALGSEIVDSR